MNMREERHNGGGVNFGKFKNLGGEFVCLEKEKN